MMLATRKNSDRRATPHESERRSPPESRVGLRPPVSPQRDDEAAPDFIEFLCGRFSLDRDTGTELLFQLVVNYEPSGSYRINTLEQNDNADDIAGDEIT
jgi:hypothetical protein